jgi:hypothetical protein
MRHVNQSQFDAIREAMVSNEFATKEVPTSAIKLNDNSFFKGQIEVAGQPVRVAPNFFIKLASLMKMNASLTKEFIKNEDGKVAAKRLSPKARRFFSPANSERCHSRGDRRL